MQSWHPFLCAGKLSDVLYAPPWGGIEAENLPSGVGMNEDFCYAMQLGAICDGERVWGCVAFVIYPVFSVAASGEAAPLPLVR